MGAEIYISAISATMVKDPGDHVKAVDHRNTKITSRHCNLGSTTVAAGFPQGK